MRFLPLLLVSQLSYADILIESPATYENGATLLADDISHYSICTMGETQVCSSKFDAVDSISDELIPKSTRSVKARTVLSDGRISEWSEPLLIPSNPLPPTLTIKITIEVTQ